MIAGEVYGQVKKLLYPKALPDRAQQGSDISIIKGLLQHYAGEEIVRMVAAFRHEVEQGGHPAGVEPRQSFGMAALKYENNVPLFRAKADKLEAERAPGIPERTRDPQKLERIGLSALLKDFLA